MKETPILALTERGVVQDLLSRYRQELTEAATSTETSVKSLRTHLASLERNLVAIAAQNALLTQLENDVTASITKQTSPITPTPYVPAQPVA